MLQFKNSESEFRIPYLESTFYEFDTFADKRKCFFYVKWTFIGIQNRKVQIKD